MKLRCASGTVDGDRCKAYATTGSKLCAFHQYDRILEAWPNWEKTVARIEEKQKSMAQAQKDIAQTQKDIAALWVAIKEWQAAKNEWRVDIAGLAIDLGKLRDRLKAFETKTGRDILAVTDVVNEQIDKLKSGLDKLSKITTKVNRVVADVEAIQATAAKAKNGLAKWLPF